jgi:hypothetical protein
MIRSLLVAFLVWLVPFVGLAQDHPQDKPPDAPLSVETVGLEPTVATTGDVITATFRVRFRNLIEDGREVMVLEDRMDPEKLAVAPFEGVGLDVRKRQVDDEHIWDFVYRFRLVNPEKGIQLLGRITFYWLVRDIGQNIEEAQVFQSETEPLQLRYVSTITEEPVLNIRDTIELGNFAGRAALFRTVAWVVAPLPLVLWAAGLVLALRRRPLAADTLARRPSEETDEAHTGLTAPPTPWQARRDLRRQLSALGDLSAGSDELFDVERRLVISLREYLKVEEPRLNPGDTAKEIKRYVDTTLGAGRREDILRALARRLVGYQNDLERGAASIGDPATEAREVESLLHGLRLRARAGNRLRKVVGRG